MMVFWEVVMAEDAGFASEVKKVGAWRGRRQLRRRVLSWTAKREAIRGIGCVDLDIYPTLAGWGIK